MRQPLPSTKFETIGSQARILTLLKRFRDKAASLTVTVPGSDAQYLSSILDIDPDAGLLILDELKPDDGHQLLLAAGHCNVSMYLRGQGLHFSAALVSHAAARGIAYYRVGLPSRMRHYTQRGAHRVTIPMMDSMPVVVRDHDTALEGRVLDVSLGGLAFSLPRSDWTDGLKPGRIIPLVRLARDGSETVEVPVEVRYTALARDRASVRVGARYADLARDQVKALERFVVELERYRLRKLVRA